MLQYADAKYDSALRVSSPDFILKLHTVRNNKIKHHARPGPELISQ